MIKLIFVLLFVVGISCSQYGYGNEYDQGYHYSTYIRHPPSYHHYEPSYYPSHYDTGSYKVNAHNYGHNYKSGYSTVYNIRHYPKYHHYEQYPKYQHYEHYPKYEHYEHYPKYQHYGGHYKKK